MRKYKELINLLLIIIILGVAAGAIINTMRDHGIEIKIPLPII